MKMGTRDLEKKYREVQCHFCKREGILREITIITENEGKEGKFVGLCGRCKYILLWGE